MRAPMERMSKQVQRFVDLSGLNKIAQGFEWIGRAARSVLRTLVEIVPVLGTITGAASIAGMVKLVQSYSNWSQQLVSTADSLGVTTQQLQQFQDATRLAGGNADDMTEAMKAFYKVQTDFVRGQAGPEAIGWLNRLGINIRDANGHLRNMNDIMPEVIQKISDIQNPADRAAASAALLGDGNMKLVEAFRRSHQSFSQWLTDAQRYTELSDRQKDQLQSFAEAQGRLSTAFDHLGQQIAATLANNFTPLMNRLSEFVEKHTPEIIAAVDRISKQFADWLANIDWDKVQGGLNAMLDSLKWVATHLDDIKTVAEIIAGIFVTKWGIQAVTAIGQVVSALGTIGASAAGSSAAAAGGTGLLGALGAVSVLAAALVALGATYMANKKGQNEIIEGAAKEGFTQYNPMTATQGPSFTNPTTGETRTWVEQMQKQGKVPEGYSKEGYSPEQQAIGGWIRRNITEPLGLSKPAQGQLPQMVTDLPGDPTWGDYGTRANNPGNMNYASWQNAAGRYSYFDKTEGRQHTMAVYNTMEEGIADTYKLMAQKQAQYGKTISGALSAWSTTPGYAAKVAGTAGLDPNAPFDITTADPDTVRRLMASQFQWEGGKRSHFASSEQILGGIGMARGGVPPANVPPGGANGKVDVAITGKNLPPDSAVTASGSGAVNVPPPRVEYQNFSTV